MRKANRDRMHGLCWINDIRGIEEALHDLAILPILLLQQSKIKILTKFNNS